ncbi:MAG: ATP-binding protein [Phycisphaerales bacterium]|nr:ATP-binding protein [Phycisphaerales bacterium]
MNADPHVKIDMLSQPRYLAGARAMIASVARRLGFGESDCAHVALALDEALCNVIKHGYEKRDDQHIWISIWPLHGSCCGIRILVEDRGRQVDPEEIRSRQLDDIRPGGLGVHIISQVMDRVQYAKREGGGMSLLMEKHLAAGQAPFARKETA